MPYKKHNWVSYGRQGEIIEITVRGQDMQKLDSFRCNNKKDYGNIIRILKDKYGFSAEVPIEKPQDFQEEQDWLDPEMN